MEYREPDTVLGDENYLSYIERARESNDFGASWKFEDRMLSDRDNFIHEFTRELNYYKDQEKRLETQQNLMVEELWKIFKVIKDYYVVKPDDVQHILLLIHEIAKNAFDHAKSDLYAKFEFSKLEAGVLFKFTLADKGPGIKQHLINLFSNKEFIDKFRKNTFSAEKIYELTVGGNIDPVYKQYIHGQGISTRLEDPGGNFFDRVIKDAIQGSALDLIFRDDQYEHTFSNKKGFLFHEEIKHLPYKLVYQGAKVFPNKP